jgi:HTH-type transcriptional regulator/antitoxin HipB
LKDLKHNRKSFREPEIQAGEQVVTLPHDHFLGESIDDFIDQTTGSPGSAKRIQFESDLKMEVLQQFIKAARKKRNLSQDELGQLIGVKKAQISKLEKGYDNASLSTIAKVFNALDATVKVSVEMDGQLLELY